MSKIFRNVIKAVKGEDVLIPTLTVTGEVVSATFSYLSTSMDAPVEEPAEITNNGVDEIVADPDAEPPVEGVPAVPATLSFIDYTLSDSVTSTLEKGLYTFCIKCEDTEGFFQVLYKGYLIIDDDIFIVPTQEEELPT